MSKNYNTINIIYFLSISFIILLILTMESLCQQQDLISHNGGSILVMAGANSLAMAVDKRFGYGPQTVNISPRNSFSPHSRLLVGFTGLEGDVQSLCDELSIKVSSKMDRRSGFGFLLKDKGSFLKSHSLCVLLSHILYEKKKNPYYVESIVAGLDKVYDENSNISYVPFLCSHDVIGARSYSKSFLCCGAASKSLYGNAETMWKPNLSQKDLINICGKVFLSALERDCLSGNGAILYLITSREGIIEYELTCRTD